MSCSFDDVALKEVRLAVIPGDGIGKEVVPVALEAIEAAMRVYGRAALRVQEFPWGCDYYVREGAMMPPNGLEILKAFDAIYLGAIGNRELVPDHVSLWGLLIKIRRGFKQSLNIRPARLLPGMRSPLREPGEVDVLVVRENSEGEYSEVGGVIHDGPDQTAMQVSVFTRRACERAIRYAFERAVVRRGKLTSATKSNGIIHTMPFWDRVFGEVAVEFPSVKAESIHIDALAAKLVSAPSTFDVIVGSNLLGDVITDLTAAVMGSVGLAPAANVNPDGVFPSMFEPVHGSAPDIAGRGIANPIGQVWTGVMMLEHLGLDVEASSLFKAMSGTLAAGFVTPDLGGSLTTTQVGRRIRDSITN